MQPVFFPAPPLNCSSTSSAPQSNWTPNCFLTMPSTSHAPVLTPVHCTIVPVSLSPSPSPCPSLSPSSCSSLSAILWEWVLFFPLYSLAVCLSQQQQKMITHTPKFTSPWFKRSAKTDEHPWTTIPKERDHNTSGETVVHLLSHLVWPFGGITVPHHCQVLYLCTRRGNSQRIESRGWTACGWLYHNTICFLEVSCYTLFSSVRPWAPLGLVSLSPVPSILPGTGWAPSKGSLNEEASIPLLSYMNDNEGLCVQSSQ